MADPAAAINNALSKKIEFEIPKPVEASSSVPQTKTKIEEKKKE